MGLPGISGGRSSYFSSTKIPTCTDVITDSHIWSDWSVGFHSGTDGAAGSGCVADISSGSLSVAGISSGTGSAVDSAVDQAVYSIIESSSRARVTNFAV